MKPSASVFVIFAVLLMFISPQLNAWGLEEGFADPPKTAYPRTWMHAMSGNMSKEGMTKDLEAMADAGIGGIILFNVTHSIPKGKVLFNSPLHTEITRHAAMECERLGLSFGLHNCDGWTSSGGPWVTPDISMKQVVHSETIVKGGGSVSLSLPIPTARGGFYRDIAVLAYPALPSELADQACVPVVTCSDKRFNVKLATDGRIDARTKINSSSRNPAWIQFDYGKPYTIRSVYMNMEKAISDKGDTLLLTSDDGVNFKKVQTLKLQRQGKREHGFDDHFDGITARYFRIQTGISFDISEVNLSATYRLGKMLARTSLFRLEDSRLPSIGSPDREMIINRDDIVDLTSSMDASGNLRATLAPGDWTVMRFGYTVTGAVNSPASDEGRGWEVDKMDKAALKVHYDAYVGKVIHVSKDVAPNALQYMEIDSYEVGGQNWTAGYEKQFKEHFGYDLVPFLPLYAGRFVDSPKTSDDVLWDVRSFNSRLMTDNYFGHFTELCHQDGLISYIEPYSFNAAFNELDAGGHADVPMGEFWMHQRYQTETAVSSGRTYGRKVISAESFSASSELNWKSHPGFMKLTGDKAWSLGINEFMFHRFAHQANTHVMPGMTMSQWGSHIDRTQTWWNNAGKAWFRYIARGSYLLRQGNPVSDLLVFIGDGASSSIAKRSSFRPNIPAHVNFDCINADALIHRITVQDGKLTLPEGTQYSALALFNSDRMSFPTLKKLAELSKQGAVLIGPKPKEPGGYGALRKDKGQFNELASRTWARKTTYASFDWDRIFKENNIAPDLVIDKRRDISYIHRRTNKEDIYFFYNPDEVARTFDCQFRVAGKIPELWNPMTGDTRNLIAFRQHQGQTAVPITFPAHGSAFIVFRQPISGLDTIVSQSGKAETYLDQDQKTRMCVHENGQYRVTFQSKRTVQVDVDDLPKPIELTGPWNVTFQKRYGYDDTLTFPKLIDWKDHASEAVRYYSGTAAYQTRFQVSPEMLRPDKKVELDLGRVEIAARVILNGRDMGVLWKLPYIVDVTDAVTAGQNQLTLEVTNPWTNRLIGDQRYPDTSGYSVRAGKMPQWYTDNQTPPPSQRLTFCAYPFYKASDKLITSGLIGPVRLTFAKDISLEQQ